MPFYNGPMFAPHAPLDHSLSPLLDTLNPEQRDAVEHVDGPLLILAGAGSGKTRVIAAKVGHLIERGCEARRIVAITFTNRAAREMRATGTFTYTQEAAGFGEISKLLS